MPTNQLPCAWIDLPGINYCCLGWCCVGSSIHTPSKPLADSGPSMFFQASSLLACIFCQSSHFMPLCSQASSQTSHESINKKSICILPLLYPLSLCVLSQQPASLAPAFFACAVVAIVCCSFRSLIGPSPFHSPLSSLIRALKMIGPVRIEPNTYFYATGNTPAVNLAQSLPPEKDGTCLLLGCGDVRNVLFTAYSRQSSGKCLDLQGRI